MRKYLFRGKSKDNGMWVVGDFIYPCNIVFESIGYDEVLKQKNVPIWNDYEVIPDTVGQYTGLNDKNGKEIFEGDIVKLAPPDEDFSLRNPREERILKVVFFKGMFALDMHKWWKYGHGMCALGDYEAARLEVIGDIYDKPELVE